MTADPNDIIREALLKFHGGMLALTINGSDQWVATVTRNRGTVAIAEGRGGKPTSAIADLKVVRRR